MERLPILLTVGTYPEGADNLQVRLVLLTYYDYGIVTPTLRTKSPCVDMAPSKTREPILKASWPS